MTCFNCKFYDEQFVGWRKLGIYESGWCRHPSPAAHGINGHPSKHSEHPTWRGCWCFREEHGEKEPEQMTFREEIVEL